MPSNCCSILFLLREGAERSPQLFDKEEYLKFLGAVRIMSRVKSGFIRVNFSSPEKATDRASLR